MILSARSRYSQLHDEDGVTYDEEAMETEQKPPNENKMTMKRGAQMSPDNSQQGPKRRSFRPNVQLSLLSDQEDRHQETHQENKEEQSRGMEKE